MCVIQASKNTAITKDQIEAGFTDNKYGSGVAWIDFLAKGGPVVRWKKGIETAQEVVDLVATLKPPYVVHHRLPTEDLDDIELTHPFPIDADASDALEGSTKGLLLFHNGKWAGWRKEAFDTCKAFGVKLPKGIWSDTRTMAWMAHHYGEEALQLIDEKALVFGLNPDGTVHFELFGINKFKDDHQNQDKRWNFKGNADTGDGIWFSNSKWEKHLPKVHTNLRDIKNHKQHSGGFGGDRRTSPNFQPNGESGTVGQGVSGGPLEQNQVEGCEAPAALRPGESRKLIDDPILKAAMAKVHQDQDALQWAMQINPKHYTSRTIGFLGRKEQVH